MPNWRQVEAKLYMPLLAIAMNLIFSSMGQVSFQGMRRSSLRAPIPVNHVPGLKCQPSARFIPSSALSRREREHSVSRDGHAIDEDRAVVLGAAHRHVAPDRHDAAEHVEEVARDRDLLDRKADLAAF